MASFLALLDDHAFDKYSRKIAAGAVLPIESHRSEEEQSFADGISRGGALYLVCVGDDDEIWLVAVLESPLRSGLTSTDRRAPGWYAPANTTPVTNIRSLKSKLGLRGELGDALEDPLQLTPKKEALLRELLGDSDAPVLGVIEVQTAPKLDGPPLSRAASYLAGGHVVAAIGALAEAWRDSRVPELADLIDRASRVAPGYDRPLFDRRVSAWNDSSPLWDETFAGDPVARLPQLLLGLAVGGTDATSKRAAKLAELPDDPRIGRRLAELIPAGPSEFDHEPSYWAPMIDVWLRDRDARLCDTILEGEPQITGPKAKKLFAHARSPKPLELSDADRPMITAIERELHRLEEPTRLEHDLVDGIAAHPDDDAARQIYADRLQERGHPRGEYIALSCQKHRGALTPALARRLALLSELPYLCGPLDDLATRRLRPHDRGIDRTLQVSWRAMPITWFEVAAHPLVRALETIELMGDSRSSSAARRAAGIAAVASGAPKLARIDAIGAKIGKQVAAKLPGWKVVGSDLVRG